MARRRPTRRPRLSVLPPVEGREDERLGLRPAPSAEDSRAVYDSLAVSAHAVASAHPETMTLEGHRPGEPLPYEAEALVMAQVVLRQALGLLGPRPATTAAATQDFLHVALAALALRVGYQAGLAAAEADDDRCTCGRIDAHEDGPCPRHG